MITLKNGLVVMPQFMEAFEKLMKMEMPIAKCLQLSTTMEELDAQIKIVNRSRRVFLEKHCKKDDKGQFVVDDDGNATFDTPDIKSQCLKSIDEIMNETFDIKLEEKIMLPADTKMLPQDFILLKDIVEVKEEEKK